MKLHQISIFAENKPGRLIAPAKLLADASIDLRALFLADTEQFGILRLIVSDWQEAARILDANGFTAKVTEVIAAKVADQPGGLAQILTALDGSGLNIEYMYAFPQCKSDAAIFIIRFADPDAAIEHLRSAGIALVDPDELLEK